METLTEKFTPVCTDYVLNYIQGAIERDIPVELMPPHISLLGYQKGDEEVSVCAITAPDLMGDSSEETHGLDIANYISTHTLDLELEACGFLYWCIIESNEGEDLVMILIHLEGEGKIGLITSLDLQEEFSQVEDFSSIPMLNIDFSDLISKGH